MTTDAERWDAKWAERDGQHAHDPWLDEVAHWVPTAGAALDVAGGSGRNAVWLARHGLATTVVDVSPVGLGLAAGRAADEGLSLRCEQHNLESEGLPPGPWAVVLVTDYLQRERMREVASVLAPGGVLLWRHPTVRNLERHARPSRRFLLEEGEGLALLSGLELVAHEEDWGARGRHELRVVARR